MGSGDTAESYSRSAMAAYPHAEIIPRVHPLTRPSGDPKLPAADWVELAALLCAGSATTWLSVPSPTGVHVRPLFAAWTGTSFVLASKHSAVKSRYLDEDGRCSLAIDVARAHLVVEGTATRVTGEAELGRASRAMLDVYGWPTTVVGDELDASYAAPTSGGPPFRVYEVTPDRAFAFPTNDQFEPTRFTFA
jgi:hypothetical protein